MDMLFSNTGQMAERCNKNQMAESAKISIELT